MAPARLAAPIRPGALRPEGRTLQVSLDREVRGPRGLDLRDPQVPDQPRVEAGLRDRSTPVIDVDPRDPRAVPLREVEHPLGGRVLTRLAEREQRVAVRQHELGDASSLREPDLPTNGLEKAA